MKTLFFISVFFLLLSCSKDTEVTTPDHKCDHLIGKWCNTANECYIFKTDNTYEYSWRNIVEEKGPWNTDDCIYNKLKRTLGLSGSEYIHIRSYTDLAIDLQTDRYTPATYRSYYKK
jgi:hypothetical protein